jgi:hypothetical protein
MLRRALISAALVLGVATGSPASAQITQEGLINVAIDDATVQVPIAVAANICGVAVNLLSQDLQDGDATCDALGTSVSRNEGGDGGPVRQEGLVNIAVTDLVVQVPIAVAANICGVAVNVLVQDSRTGDVICEAEGVSRAFR